MEAVKSSPGSRLKIACGGPNPMRFAAILAAIKTLYVKK
jgi:hypothetical protein